ncbi:kinase [Sulfuricaulis sp.]|jgi:D-glycero-alpha-D-manno-heptose-7-phosphate kinase|uniref:GHMP family kinase ATP-binding protein n=1 Tax=Sulfuricaulis sp. TaxID=2003553 RepID=UPI00355A73F7
MIISRTPFRISFFGGGTDYPAWFRENGGAVLSTAIDKYCYISCRYLPQFFEHKYRIVYSKIENIKVIQDIEHPAVRAVLTWLKCDKGLEIHHDGDLPARSGLGSSSSFTVGLINAIMALSGKYISSAELADCAIHIEQNILKENVGSQDQIAVAYGGFNRVEFKTDGTYDVTSIILPPERKQMLESHLMLFFTGLSRLSSDVEKTKINNYKNREVELRKMAEMVNEAMDILNGPDRYMLEFGKLLDEGWRYKKSLSDMVSMPVIDQIYDAALKVGAIGGKILGAGGGGFLLLFAPPENQARVKEQLKDLIHVPIRFENSGSKIVLYQPSGLV